MIFLVSSCLGLEIKQFNSYSRMYYLLNALSINRERRVIVLLQQNIENSINNAGKKIVYQFLENICYWKINF